MADLITQAELENYLGLDADDLDGDASAAQAMAFASAEIRSWCRVDFEDHAGDDIVLDGNGSTVLLLPVALLRAVSSVTEDPDDEATVLDVVAYEWGTHGVLRRIDGGVFARRFRYYEVNADHGYTAVPDDVKLVAARVAARVFTNPDGVSQESLGGYSYSIAATVGSGGFGGAGIGLLPSDWRALAPYRIDP